MLESYFHDTLMAIVTACTPIIIAYLFKLAKIQDNTLANTIATTAINRAAGVALDYGLRAGDSQLTRLETKSPAFQEAVNYAKSTAGPQLNKLKVNDAELATKISSQLAILLNSATPSPTPSPTAALDKSIQPPMQAATISPVQPAGKQPLAVGQKFIPKGK